MTVACNHPRGRSEVYPPHAADRGNRTRLVVGAGALGYLGEVCQEMDGGRVLLVTDPGLVACGHAERAIAVLRQTGRRVFVFDEVVENPDEDNVEACAAMARKCQPDVLVGLGGGSALDVAKGCAFVVAGGGRMADYWGRGKAVGSLLPIVAVPTTAGTGSEMQSFALIANVETHQKMACGDPQAAARVALLDPELTLTLPARVTAITGLDTVGHAVESAVTRAATPLSELYSADSFRRASRSLVRVLTMPDDLDARLDMMLAAAHGGLAIENSMLGAAHSMANPLTAHHGIPHGQAVGLMLPAVVRFNREEPHAAERYAVLAQGAALVEPGTPEKEAVGALVDHLEELVAKAGFAPRLSAYGVSAGDCAVMARESAQQWTAQFNPRAVAAADFETMLKGAV